LPRGLVGRLVRRLDFHIKIFAKPPQIFSEPFDEYVSCPKKFGLNFGNDSSIKEIQAGLYGFSCNLI